MRLLLKRSAPLCYSHKTMSYEEMYHHLTSRLILHAGEGPIAQVRLAFEIAERAHAGQMRDEGTPYILHPLRVAISLVDELNIYSARMVSAALLHDVIEDSETTREQIAEMFGEQVARAVWLLTKLETVSLQEYLAAIEAAPETGAPIVKLCDRLDNLRHLARSPKLEKKLRCVRTTEMYYLPLAERTHPYLHEQMRSSLESARSHLASLA